MAERIIIDAGHNGLTDPGAVYNGRRESDDVLRLAMAVGDILSRNGFDVVYTRTGDIDQSVTQKAQLANSLGADLFISLHRNKASYPGQYEGVQTLIYDQGGIKPQMAENINRALEAVGYNNINVETRPDLAVLRRTQMPALLVEAGFIDSAKDNQLFDTRFQETAQAIADGIMETLDSSAVSSPARYAAGMPQGDEMAAEMPQNPDNPGSMESAQPFRPDAPLPPLWPPFATPQTPPSSQDAASAKRPLYRIQVGAFYNLQNAVALEQELKRMGYNTWIVTD